MTKLITWFLVNADVSEQIPRYVPAISMHTEIAGEEDAPVRIAEGVRATVSAIGKLRTMALTVAYLGDPDWGVLLSSYLGCMLMAGTYLGICSLTSAFTKNQVISFVISVFVCFVMVLLGWSVFTDFLGGYLGLPAWVVDLVSNFSFKTHFDGFVKGIIDPKDVVFFLSLAGFCLCSNVLVLER